MEIGETVESINNNATVRKTKGPMPMGVTSTSTNQSRGSTAFNDLDFQRMAEFMQAQGLMLVEAGGDKQNSLENQRKAVKEQANRNDRGNCTATEVSRMNESNSEITIYRNAIRPEINEINNKRISLSSDEMPLDTSGESEQDRQNFDNVAKNVHQFITENAGMVLPEDERERPVYRATDMTPPPAQHREIPQFT